MDYEYEEEPKVTLFPTRLREFEEKNNLVFHHILSVKNRRSSDITGLNFGDQYTRRKSCTELDVIDYNDEKFEVMKNVFRRASTTDKKSGRMDVIQTRLLPIIFQRMGQDYDEQQLQRWIKSNDPHGLGVVDFNGYQRICVHFLKDPRAVEKAKTEEFSFNNLINELNESENSSSSPDISDSE